MRNIKLTIEYDGTNYCGWQIQNKKLKQKKENRTIQQILENFLSKILQEKIKLVGSGRTDSGVHALGQVANFKTKSKLNLQNIHNGLNSILPLDIRIREAEVIRMSFHARFSAKRKLYRYTIVNNSFISPFERRYAYLVKFPLNLRKMRKAARLLLGKHDFRSFQAVEKDKRHSVRKIFRLDIRKKDDLIYLDIEADGFLYKMVRNIVGTLIEVGRAKIKPEDIKTILKSKDRSCAGPCASAKGLNLLEVTY